MLQKKSMFFMLMIMVLSTFTIHLFGKTKIPNSYEFKHLDRSNTQQVNQVRQLFASSPMQSTNRFCSPDLEKWISNNAYKFLLAVDTNGSICGCAVYFIFKHQELHLRTVAISTKHKWKDVAIQLLQQFELVPNKIKICTLCTQQNSAFYKLFKKLKYEQINEWVTLCKKINKDSIASTNNTSICAIRFLDRQNSEEIKLFSELFHADEVGSTRTPEQMQKLTTHTDYQFLVAFDTNNQPCAGLIYRLLFTDWEFQVFAVHKDYRRQGIATAMLQTVAQLALQQNIEELIVHTLLTNNAGIACYKKQGFIEKEIFYEIEKEIYTSVVF